MNTWSETRRPNLRLSTIEQRETMMREYDELDPHPTCIGAILLSLLCWGIVVGAVWGLWAVARWVLA